MKVGKEQTFQNLFNIIKPKIEGKQEIILPSGASVENKLNDLNSKSLIPGDTSIKSTKTLTSTRTKLDHYWESYTWNMQPLHGMYIWSDGNNIYYSNQQRQYVFNKNTSTWATKTWNGSFTNFTGDFIWTDGDNIYYSYNSDQYVLNRLTSTWEQKEWIGLGENSLIASSVWTDGINIYYSTNASHYILNKDTSTWSTKTWSGLTNFYGGSIWTDGDNIYYSRNTNQYVLNGNTWTAKVWNGVSQPKYIWTDGTDIYCADSNGQNYILDKSTSTWNAISILGWEGLTTFTSDNIWTNGNNIYFSYGPIQYILR